MAIGRAIFEILSQDVQVDGLVDQRIYPNKIDYDSTNMPAIVYTIIDNRPTNTKTSVSQLDETFVLISCFADTYARVVDLSNKVRDAFDPYYAIDATISTNKVQSISFEDFEDQFDDSYGQYGINYRQLKYKFRIKR